VRHQFNEKITYLGCVVCKEEVELASERCYGPDINMETTHEPLLQHSNDDHAKVTKCQGAQDETGRRLVEHRVLERVCSFLVRNSKKSVLNVAPKRTDAAYLFVVGWH